MVREEIVTLKNFNGQTLFGILHVPDDVIHQKKRTGINLLNPGLKNRLAPNRLYVKIARELVHQGYYVLRMDPAGIGDSEGEIPEDSVVDIWGEIQQGRFVQDVIAMNDYFLRTCDLERLVLVGSCGGAITAILSAEKDRRVNDLILIDVPVTLSSTSSISKDHLSIIEADHTYRSNLTAHYLKSILNPQKWLKFITLKSDYRAILKIMILKLKELRGRKVKPLNETANDPEQSGISNINPHFIRAFKDVISKGSHILFLCAERDTDTQLFYKGFHAVHLRPCNTYMDFYSVLEIKDANHIYTLNSSQDELIERISEWMVALRSPRLV